MTLPVVTTLEKIFHHEQQYSSQSNIAGTGTDSLSSTITIDKELKLMMIGCEESCIYGPNENIAVSCKNICFMFCVTFSLRFYFYILYTCTCIHNYRICFCLFSNMCIQNNKSQ